MSHGRTAQQTANAFGYISCTSCRYRKHELPDVGDRHRVNGLVAVSRENVGLQPPEGGFGVPRETCRQTTSSTMRERPSRSCFQIRVVGL